MNAPGFDWLNVPSSGNSSGTNSPAPPVSFGYKSSASLRNRSSENIPFRNTSADQLLNRNSRSSDLSKQGNESNGDTEDSVPLSLTAQDLTLQESKTYMRWYSDILARTNSRTITMNDVYNFLNNFKISHAVKEKINKIFQKILQSINIGEFFAVLRLISHALKGEDPKRMLIKYKTQVPIPTSILSKKRHNEDDGDDSDGNLEMAEDSNTEPKKPLDLDSFTQFMLTGERPDEKPKKGRSKKLKSVKFSDQIVTDIHDDSFASPIGSPSPQSQAIDYSLPMDQLLNRMRNNPPTQQLQQQDEDEQEILKDMESQINHFKNLHSVDTASIGGVPANLDFQPGHSQLLRPNMTGPAQMSQLFSPSPETQGLKPNMTGPNQMQQMRETNGPLSPLNPNVTGPNDMAKIFAPQASQETPQITLQSFTDQMTGNTQANTLVNSTRTTTNGSPMRSTSASQVDRPLPPPPVPAARRSRSVSSPMPSVLSSMPQDGPRDNNSAISLHSDSPLPQVNGHEKSQHKVPPPPPPPSRRRAATSSPPPPPLPPKSTIYSNENDSTANILDDLKALQAEVDRIRDMTGGF